MTRFQLICGLLLALAITIGAGAMHGHLSGRWGGPDLAAMAAQKLESLPEEFGPWTTVRSDTLSESESDQLQPYGYVSRTCMNLDTEQQITFFILVGPVGPTAVHNPEICFSSRNFTITQPKAPTDVAVSGRWKDQFWAMTFLSNSLEGGLLRVYYGWSDGTKWEAAANGRFEYAGLPYLYKIQLAAHLPRKAALDSQDACRLFLKDLIPVLREHMLPAKRK